MLFPECIFVVVLALLNGPNREVLWRIPIFFVILVKMWGSDPPGFPCMGLSLTVMQLILINTIMLCPECVFVVVSHY